jgi:hypothetical protein
LTNQRLCSSADGEKKQERDREVLVRQKSEQRRKGEEDSSAVDNDTASTTAATDVRKKKKKKPSKKKESSDDSYAAHKRKQNKMFPAMRPYTQGEVKAQTEIARTALPNIQYELAGGSVQEADGEELYSRPLLATALAHSTAQDREREREGRGIAGKRHSISSRTHLIPSLGFSLGEERKQKQRNNPMEHTMGGRFYPHLTMKVDSKSKSKTQTSVARKKSQRLNAGNNPLSIMGHSKYANSSSVRDKPSGNEGKRIKNPYAQNRFLSTHISSNTRKNNNSSTGGPSVAPIDFSYKGHKKKKPAFKQRGGGFDF